MQFTLSELQNEIKENSNKLLKENIPSGTFDEELRNDNFDKFSICEVQSGIVSSQCKKHSPRKEQLSNSTCSIFGSNSEK